MINNREGTNKNDCERTAAKRFITGLRRDHPHLKIIVVEDALVFNAPHIKHLGEHDLRYILGTKPGAHKFLFNWLATHPAINTHTQTTRTGKGTTTHHYCWINGAPLNEANMELEAISSTIPRRHQMAGQDTGLPIDETSVAKVMTYGRARWKIENDMPLSA